MAGYIAEMSAMSEEERRKEIADKIWETANEITDSEVFCDESAVTNAVGWGLDDYEILEIRIGADEVRVPITYSASGEQLDKGSDGDAICGKADVVIDDNGEVHYEEITAEVALEGEK